MQWNRYGEYNPVEMTPCTTECGLCLKVCPFATSGENEDTIGERLYGAVPGIQHRSETGYYLTSYVGYSEKHRPTSASGGMATWLLEALLAEGVVDHVICVAPTGDPERLFAFQVFDTPEEVRTGAGSAYYPVEMSAVIRQVIEVPGRYAVTGLPCFLKAIRLAQQRNKKLRERIVVTVGLVCGQLKSRHYTDYLALLSGMNGKPVRVKYHSKRPDTPAADYHFICENPNGERSKEVFFSKGMGEAWVNRWFTINACNHCDDIFAECADVVCMDAWLPEYWNDPEGYSLIIVRSPRIFQTITDGIQREQLKLKEISIDDVIRSQNEVIYGKRVLLSYRLKLAQKQGKNILQNKRTEVGRPHNLLLSKLTQYQLEMQKESKEISQVIHFGREEDILQIRNIMKPYLFKVSRIQKTLRIMSLPGRLLKRISKQLYGVKST
jgi:coenzyme F420-reducing hydrogenase beta subunit